MQTCTDCGMEMPQHTGKGRWSTRCERCKIVYRRRYMREYQRRRLNVEDRTPDCLRCGKQFQTASPHQKYCSAECRRLDRIVGSRPCRSCAAPVEPPRITCDACRMCPYPGCDKPKTQGGGHCAAHRIKVRLEKAEEEDRRCVIDGCDRPQYVRKSGLCKMHYRRVHEGSGEVGPAGRLKAEKVPRYIDPRSGYARITHEGSRVFEHRVVMEQVLGREMRSVETVHHKNGRRDDNRPENLELWISQRPGQRVIDLIQWMVDQYPEATAKALRAPQLLTQADLK